MKNRLLSPVDKREGNGGWLESRHSGSRWQFFQGVRPIQGVRPRLQSRGSDLGSSFFLRTYGEYVPIAGVPRRLRLQYPGTIYHLIARGNGRQNIVRGDGDGDRLQEHLGKAALRCGWRVYAFAVMPNHLHIVLKTPQPNLARGMQAFLGRVAPSSNGSGRWCAANPAVSGAGNRVFSFTESSPVTRQGCQTPTV
jgi:hypothetical protein